MLRIILPLFFFTASASFVHAAPSAAQAKPAAYSSFTGKINANKVRLRVKPDLESHIFRQVAKDDLFLVVGEVGDFYAVEPPIGTKAYIFRSYILDNQVEASRVNIRLEPNTDGPIIGQLEMGARVDGTVSPLNHKWLEIVPPKSVRFYVSKEYVEKAGGPEYLSLMRKRKTDAENILAQAYSIAEEECKKPYEEMEPQIALDLFHSLLKNYLDFPECIAGAKQGLSLLKDTYLTKKIQYLEEKTGLSETAKEEIIAKHKEENRDLFSEVALSSNSWKKNSVKKEMTDAMRFWDSVEESLYLSWSAFHQDKKLDDFYQEQLANATVLTGKLEPYTHSIHEKPGSHVLKKHNVPIAYLYSTQVDLDKLVGKEVSLLAAPRPNNHFAFPAYFVLTHEFELGER